MKKFLLNLSVFSVLLFGLTFLVGCISLPDEYIIYKTAGSSYEKIAWNLHLIDREPERINRSQVFFGPSLTQAGLSDSVLSVNGIKAINMGVNGAGNELPLFFLKRVLKHHPQKIYLHLFKGGHRILHGMTPLLYTPPQLLAEGQSLSASFLRFLFKRVYFVYDYFIWKLKGSEAPVKQYASYGVEYEEPRFSQDEYAAISTASAADEFESMNLVKTGFRKKTEAGRSGLYYKFILLRRALINFGWNWEFANNRQSQRSFAEKALELCKENKVPVAQLYMPIIIDAKTGYNFDEAFYTPQAAKKVVSLTNFSFLDSVVYWSDMTHLSTQGAKLFTKQLMQDSIIVP